MIDLELRFELYEELTIVGRNPEMADFANPRGELEGAVHFIVGEAPDGQRFAHSVPVFTMNGYTINGNPAHDEEDECLTTFTVDSNGMTIERLERLAAYLNSHQPSLDPTYWTEIQACYGSEAYVRDGWEAEAVAIEREEARMERFGV